VEAAPGFRDSAFKPGRCLLEGKRPVLDEPGLAVFDGVGQPWNGRGTEGPEFRNLLFWSDDGSQRSPSRPEGSPAAPGAACLGTRARTAVWHHSPPCAAEMAAAMAARRSDLRPLGEAALGMARRFYPVAGGHNRLRMTISARAGIGDVIVKGSVSERRRHSLAKLVAECAAGTVVPYLWSVNTLFSLRRRREAGGLRRRA
jgi:hypothetical protein